MLYQKFLYVGHSESWGVSLLRVEICLKQSLLNSNSYTLRDRC